MKANKNLLIIGGMILLTIIAFLLISYFSGPSGGRPDAEVIQELTEEISDLESSLLEVEVILQEVGGDLDQKKTLLDEKYDEINILTEKLEELRKEGKVDKQTIQNLQQRIADAKNKLFDASQIEAYKKEIDLLVIDNSKVTRMVDSMKILMERYDSTFSALHQENAEYRVQLADCGTVVEPITEPVIETNSGEDWTGFRASNFNIFKNNETSPTGNMVKGSDLEKLKIQFSVEGNNVDKGERNVFVVFENFLTKETFFSRNTKGGNFQLSNGTSKLASAKAVLKYNGNKETISVQLLQDEEGQFKTGAFNAVVYCDGEMIGMKKNISIY